MIATRVDEIMQQIPADWRYRWCRAQVCACMGCVQTGNKSVMAKAQLGQPYRGDPEYIDRSKIAPEIRDSMTISHDDWLAWVKRNPTP